MLELFCDMNVVVPICEYLSWRCFWSEKKSKRSQNNHSNNERYDNIRFFFFFFFFLEMFHMSVFSFL